MLRVGMQHGFCLLFECYTCVLCAALSDLSIQFGLYLIGSRELFPFGQMCVLFAYVLIIEWPYIYTGVVRFCFLTRELQLAERGFFVDHCLCALYEKLAGD